MVMIARDLLGATAVPRRSPGEHVHVQRSLADALGAIGQQAAPALPVLRKFEGIPRVRWAARAAIRRISQQGAGAARPLHQAFK
jgi:hypothetical protein